MTPTKSSHSLVAAVLLAALVPLPPCRLGAAEPSFTAPAGFWASESFKKDFLGTYGMNPGIEPKLAETELETMQQMQQLMADDISSAAVALEEALTPDMSAQFDFILANLYFQQEKLDEAAKWYESAIAKFPKFRRAHKNLALVYAKKGEMDKAVKPLVTTIELGETSGLVYGLLGLALLGRQDFISAETAYRNALVFDPDALDYKLGLAKSIFQQQKFGEAVAISTELIRRFPDRKDFWILQANAFLGLNQPMKAAENFEIMDRMGIAPAESLTLLGDIYVNNGLMSLASSAYMRALGKGGQQPGPGIRAAKILASRSAYDEAKVLIAKIKDTPGLQLADKEKKDLLNTEARIAVAEGNNESAVKVLEEIIKMDPLDGDALMLLAQNYSRTGDADKAVFYYERAAGIEAFEADAKVRLAQLYVSQSKLDQAVPLLRRAQDVKPRDNIGEYLARVERMAKAKR